MPVSRICGGYRGAEPYEFGWNLSIAPRYQALAARAGGMAPSGVIGRKDEG